MGIRPLPQGPGEDRTIPGAADAVESTPVTDLAVADLK
jgi:hypothetical protein